MAEQQAEPERLRLLALPVKPGFGVRVIVLEPGCERLYLAEEWRDVLAQVDRGHVDLEFSGGARGRFGPGDLLWLCEMGVRVLRNREREPAVLVAMFRTTRDPAFGPSGANRDEKSGDRDEKSGDRRLNVHDDHNARHRHRG